uniref:Uncharacterized protein n=1 Tax=Megaselia scalaris TaxID=36166 RepID=T1GSS8_MEGSC
MKSEVNIHFLQQSFFDFTEDDMALHISKIEKIEKQLNDAGSIVRENQLQRRKGHYRTSHLDCAWKLV